MPFQFEPNRFINPTLVETDPLVALVRPLMGEHRAKRLDPKMRSALSHMGRSKKASELIKKIGYKTYSGLETTKLPHRSDNSLVNGYLKSCKDLMGASKQFCPNVWMAFDSATIGQEDTMFGICALNDKQAVWMAPQAALLCLGAVTVVHIWLIFLF